MTLTNVALLAEDFGRVVAMQKEERGLLKEESVAEWLEGVLHKLLNLAQTFQLNIPLRMQLKSSLKLPQLPSLLNSALLLASTKTQLKSPNDAFTDLLR
jgi:hypothetical protein